MLRAACALLLLGTAARADGLAWDLEGYPRILEAAARARKEGKRLLVGLSGAPT